jgi:hypothetical protein
VAQCRRAVCGAAGRGRHRRGHRPPLRRRPLQGHPHPPGAGHVWSPAWRPHRPRSGGGAGVAVGSIIPAAWSFMLAAWARGLGSTWTAFHLRHEREAAEVLGPRSRSCRRRSSRSPTPSAPTPGPPPAGHDDPLESVVGQLGDGQDLPAPLNPPHRGGGECDPFTVADAWGGGGAGRGQ